MDIMLGSRRRTRATVCRTVAEYTEGWNWPVVPGARLLRGPRGLRCSCGRTHCPAPGRHPAGPEEEADPAADPTPVPALTSNGELPGGTTSEDVERLWQAPPDATVLLPTGHLFDVLDVPEAAGHQAMARLERMGTRLGPVLSVPCAPGGTETEPAAPGRFGTVAAQRSARLPERRAMFFVAPGAAGELPELLYKMGWDDAGLDLRCLGAGEHVPAPPSVLGTLGPVRWLRPPAGASAAHPPEARLLLGTLAYACHRTREPIGGRAWSAS